MATIDTRVSPITGKTTYRARARLKGQHAVSKTFQRKTDAKVWASGIESAQREGRYFAVNEAVRHTLADLMDRYMRDVLPSKPKNARSQRRQLEWWKTQLGHLRLIDVTPARIAEARDRLSHTPLPNNELRAPATVVRYLAALSHAFTVAVKEWGWVDDNPCRKVTKPKEPRGRVRFLDDDERERMLAACRASSNSSLYPIVVLAISTGMRKGEILTLRWPQVDLDRGVITLHETKNGERRAVPVKDHARDQLLALREIRDPQNAFVFPGTVVGKPIDISKAWSRAVTKAELQDFRFHDLRHTAASYLAQAGATPLDIAAVLGHKTLAMVKRYAHLAESHVAEVVARMNEKAFGKLQRPLTAEPGQIGAAANDQDHVAIELIGSAAV